MSATIRIKTFGACGMCAAIHGKTCGPTYMCASRSKTFFLLMKKASSECAKCRQGKGQRISTTFGSVSVDIRASALGCAPVVCR